MCELLIKKIDATHSNPNKDKACYKAGDIVEVYEDGRCAEPPTPQSPFYILKIPGISKSLVMKFLEPMYVDTGLVGLDGKTTIKRMESRRKWCLRIDSLPTVIRNNLKDNLSVTVTKAQVNAYIRNKETSTDGF